MKQKLFLLILLLGGLIACTKDDTKDDFQMYAEDAPFIRMIRSGEFEGEWLDFYSEVVDTARLTVTDSSFQVRLPEKYILLNNRVLGSTLYVTDEYGNPVSISDNPNYYKIEYEPSNLVLEYINKGYSSESNYFELSVNSDSYKSIDHPIIGIIHYTNKYAYGDGNLEDDDEVKQSFEIGFSKDLSGQAMFDQNTGLWTIKLTLDIIVNDILGNIEFHKQPMRLVYISKKKI